MCLYTITCIHFLHFLQVRTLVDRGIEAVALVRSVDSITDNTLRYLKGAKIIECNVLDEESVSQAYSSLPKKPSSTICCLASRSGLKDESYLVDYGGGLNVFNCQRKAAEDEAFSHFVLLSAFCVGKPLLQFQFAKIKLETAIRDITLNSLEEKKGIISHSIIRPTAFFKSLDGQVESVQNGAPCLYFGNGECAANAIAERDLANYLIDCAIKPKDMDMMNTARDIGGPDVPPITKKQQINLIYETLGVEPSKRTAFSIPVG